MEGLSKDVDTVAESPRGLRSSTDTAADGPAARSDAKLKRGKSIGRYMVVQEIGHGAMGAVYSAYDPELDRRVAIKVVRAEAVELAGRTRFLREAQALAKLSHPNVVGIHDVGTLDDQVFIAMELVEGQTLRAWQRAATRTLAEVLEVYKQAGRGLHAAHAAGLVHRDFKPDNVLVGADGRVRVADFGLARARDASDADEPVRPHSGGALSLTVTQTGTMLGTPAYMAPEQMRGDAASESTDQFSFCAALWEAIYGTRPYSGSNNDELLRNLEAGTLREPTAKRKVPGWLRPCLERGLSPRAEERYASVGALLDELERIPARTRRRRWTAAAVIATAALGITVQQLQQTDSQVCRIGLDELAGTWDIGRRTAVHAAFAAVAPSKSAGITATLDALDAYANRWVAARSEACAATRIRGEQSESLLDLRMACLDQRKLELRAVVELLMHADASLVERGDETIRSLSDLASCANTQALRARMPPPAGIVGPVLVNALHEQLAHARASYDAGRYGDAMTRLEGLATQVRVVRYAPLEAEVHYVRGLAQRRAGEYKAAVASQRDAIAAAVLGAHDEVAALAAVALVGLEGDANHTDEALTWAKLAQAWLSRAGEAPAAADNLQISLGNIYSAKGRLADARAAYQKALELREKELGPADASLGQPLMGLAMVLEEEQRYDEAVATYQRALSLQEQSLGASHTDVGMTLTNLGIVYIEQQRWDEAHAASARALTIFQQALGPDHYFTAAAQSNLAAVAVGRGELEAGIAAYRQSIAIGEKALGVDSPEVASQRVDLASALRKHGRAREALTEATAALRVQEAAVGSDNAQLALAWVVVGQAQLDLRQRDAARKALERALALAPSNTELVEEAREALARASARR
jgi:tetratricopeptide (TPR) repeat protein/predicted Ser/Thr protein kinase